MAEAKEEKKPLARGVVVEFDFTAIDGGQRLVSVGHPRPRKARVAKN